METFMPIRGLIPATLTPFEANGNVDYKELEKHLIHVSSATGLYGIAVNGHAGEVLALSTDERAKIVEHAKKVIPKNIKLVAGIEGHNFDDLIEQGLRAKKAGADVLLVLPPFDVRPYRMLTHHTESVRAIFQRLNDEVDLPMIVFQYAEASGVAYSLDALRAIVEIPQVVAIKAACTSTTAFVEIMNAVGDKVDVLAASDAPSLLGMLMYRCPGALIGISVIDTQRWSDLVRHATHGELDQAHKLHIEFAMPVMDAVFENQLHKSHTSYFAATKEALFQSGHLKSARIRAPLVSPDAKQKITIAQCLHQIGMTPNALSKAA
ncbi:MAG: dihydrodipicolinate synthase family protein [Betaproteobacteria bacterium]|nr:dihydrodipicolinate synthase family protein [Betaproteobacteria bacterium]NBT66925.1 dihydrodipicolinate synthase family protein [Betaproteobacteria bacterium]